MFSFLILCYFMLKEFEADYLVYVDEEPETNNEELMNNNGLLEDCETDSDSNDNDYDFYSDNEDLDDYDYDLSDDEEDDGEDYPNLWNWQNYF